MEVVTAVRGLEVCSDEARLLVGGDSKESAGKLVC